MYTYIKNCIRKYPFIPAVAVCLVLGIALSFIAARPGAIARVLVRLSGTQTASVAAAVTSPFFYTFNSNGTLYEAGSMDESSSPYFWLNSGAQLVMQDGIGKTIQGELAVLSKWRLAYALANPADTDDGYHPQNIFRLVTRSAWQNFTQEVDFKIADLNMSESPNRNESNGILFFNRYQDDDNLYYTGIRVDGTAGIKKKMNGVYYTMAQKSFYTAVTPYNRDTNPNLIPGQKWIGLKSEVKTNPDNTVSIKIFIDKNNTGAWTLAVEAKDDGKTYGGTAILHSGYAGIRTDFMDVEFDNYKLTTLP